MIKIKKFLGLILFVFVGVLALASCNSNNSFGSFETKYYGGQTLKGDLYKSNQYNNYYFVTDSKVYMITFTKTEEGKKEPKFNDLNCEKINDDTWAYQSLGNINYILLLNDGHELIITKGDYVYVYTKTDHIEIDEVVS